MTARVPGKQLGQTTASTLILPAVTCNSTVYVGAVVRYDGVEFVNAQADTKVNGHVFGICHAKTAATVADILLPGGISGDIFVGLDPSKEYFLSDSIAGSIIIAPVPMTTGTTVWFLGKPYTTTRFLFLPELRWIN